MGTLGTCHNFCRMAQFTPHAQVPPERQAVLADPQPSCLLGPANPELSVPPGLAPRGTELDGCGG